MAHVIEPASSGRAKCRGCGRAIAKGDLRFGERHPNPFGEGEMTLWFHLLCGALKRPEPFLEILGATTESIEGRDRLAAEAQRGVEHRRLPRVDGAERASTGRARCRHCRELIEKGAWRCPLVYFDEARFQPSGFVHARCARAYLGTIDLVDRALQFSPGLSDADVDELRAALESGPAAEAEADAGPAASD